MFYRVLCILSQVKQIHRNKERLHGGLYLLPQKRLWREEIKLCIALQLEGECIYKLGKIK